jgi:hypothetical protein
MIDPKLTCAEWRSRLIELSRGRLFDVNERDRVLSHLSVCASCTALFEEQTALTSAEAMLASEMASISLPQELESILLAEYVSHARSRRRRFFAFKPAVITGVIAATLLCGWLVRPRRAPRVPPSASVPTAVAAVLPHTSDPQPPVPAVRRARQKIARQKIAHEKKPAPPSQPAETVEPFVEIPYTLPLDPRERAVVVRMEMPVAALTAVGLNIAVSDSSATAHADVIVGVDGRMRAIRLLSISDSNPDRSIHQ